jgi:hypothetical protein
VEADHSNAGDRSAVSGEAQGRTRELAHHVHEPDLGAEPQLALGERR